MFAAAILDMDGVIVDSEPLWRRAEIQVFRERVGLALSEAQCTQTMGMRIDHVVQHWLAIHPRDNCDVAQVARAIVDEVRRLILLEGRALPGVHRLVTLLRHQGLKLGLASSSPLALIETVLVKLGLTSAFEAVRSAESEVRGKPDPAVYLSAARSLSVQPAHCLVFEDSLTGIAAARAAAMCVVAVPALEQRTDPRYAAADLLLNSLEDFTAETLSRLNAAQKPK